MTKSLKFILKEQSQPLDLRLGYTVMKSELEQREIAWFLLRQSSYSAPVPVVAKLWKQT
jgi:hypothetical protein